MSNFFSKATLSWSDKRRATFAGTWYESDPAKLKVQLMRFLQTADAELKKTPIEPAFSHNEKIDGAVLAIVVPHAGYMFSGQTAAYAYDAAKSNRKFKRVFLLGPSHYAGFQGAALPAEKIFATPLGDLSLDKDVVDALGGYSNFAVMPEVHRREHSLEMQLPFIKQAFGDVKIVPIIVGALNDNSEVQLMAQVIRRYIEPGDLVVVSSDFTHYGPRYEYEPFTDNVREGVRNLDSQAFDCLNQRDLDAFIAFRVRTQDTICGFYPCSLLLALLPEGAHASLLRYRTSQDTHVEDDKNSVSYLAIAFSSAGEQKGWPAENAATSVDLTEDDKERLLKIARQALETFVRERREVSRNEIEELITPVMQKQMGAFVTLYKRGRLETEGTAHGDEKELRGCIGYIWPVKPLLQAVIENAIGAASRDYRFKNVTPDELPFLQIDINVLTPPRRVKSQDDIVIGRDGVLLYKDGKQAVFLPSVATDFGWTLEQTLSQLALKAGCSADGWKQGANFDVFQSCSFEEQH
jgi:hypothetical protein